MNTNQTSESPAVGNGRVERKSLASQLDRLDGIIDALAEGLNDYST